jgi:hypothetical protein
MSGDEPDTDGSEESALSRRRLVAAGATGWATVSLAGCSRVLDPSMKDSGDDGDGGNGSGGNGGDGNGGGGNGDGDGGTGDGGTPDGDGGNGNGGQETPPTGNTTVTNETTTTGDPGGEAPTTTEGGGGGECASIRRFSAGMEVGLHVEIFDDDTGDFLGDGAVEGVSIEFPDADYGPVDLNWEGDHEAYSETTWGGKIVTSEDADAGEYRYEITVDRGDGDTETLVDEFTIV